MPVATLRSMDAIEMPFNSPCWAVDLKYDLITFILTKLRLRDVDVLGSIRNIKYQTLISCTYIKITVLKVIFKKEKIFCIKFNIFLKICHSKLKQIKHIFNDQCITLLLFK